MNASAVVVSAFAVFLAGFLSASAQQAGSDHEPQAHGKPIVQGHHVQPKPGVVEERLKHHEQLLQSQPDRYTGPRAVDDQQRGTPQK